MTHSVISPSSANKWGSEHGCTGYVKMALLYPQRHETEAAREGTAAHEIGETTLKRLARGFDPRWNQFDGKTASNGVMYDHDMYDAATMYIKDVHNIMRKANAFGGDFAGVEKRVDVKGIHEVCYGFVDAWVRNGNHLYVWDFKYGQRYIDVFECLQLIIYVYGITALYDDFDNDTKITVHMRIVQPRTYHSDGPIREWVVNLSELRGYFNQLHGKAHEALSSDAKIRSGPHCRDCCALHACPAAMRAGMSIHETAMQTKPINLTASEMAVQYSITTRAIQQLEYIQTSLAQQMESNINKGSIVPGYTMEPGTGTEIWTKTPLQIATLGDTLKNDLRKPLDVITVKQARTKGITPALLGAVSTKKAGKLKLKPTNPKILRRIFQ